MSERRILRCKPTLRPEQRDENRQNETQQPDHPASLRDSVPSSTWICDATKEAQDLIRSDTKAAVDIYKEGTGDKTSADDLLAWLKEPGMMEWNLEPQGTMKFANHLFKTGTLKTQPKFWTDYYLPIAHDLKGS